MYFHIFLYAVYFVCINFSLTRKILHTHIEYYNMHIKICNPVITIL